MGNNNSNQSKPADSDFGIDILQQLFAKDLESRKEKMSKEEYDNAYQMYADIWTEMSDYDKSRIGKKIDILSNKGTDLPYYSDLNIFHYNQNAQNYVSEETPRYVEFKVCRGDISELTEKYAVHNGYPGHNCGANCYCIDELIEISGDKIKSHGAHRVVRSESVSPNVSQIVKDPRELFSEFDELELLSKILSKKNTLSDNLTISPTSSETLYRPTRNSIANQNRPSNRSALNNLTLSPTSSETLYRPSQTKPSNLVFSPTSSETLYKPSQTRPSNLVFSPTSTETLYQSQPNNKQSRCKLSMLGGAFSDTSELEDDDSDNFSATSELTVSSNDNPKKKKSDSSDSSDSSTEELEDLDVDGEETTEEGFIMEQSDITSSDLYRMQSRIFGSETSTDAATRRVSYTNKWSNSFTDSESDDKNTTERVRKAMSRINNRNNLFDSEDHDILDMNSSTSQYMKRPVKKNSKYH